MVTNTGNLYLTSVDFTYASGTGTQGYIYTSSVLYSTNSNYTGGKGGIYLNKGTAYVTGGYFKNIASGTSRIGGGAVYAFVGTTLVVTGTTFYNVSAQQVLFSL